MSELVSPTTVEASVVRRGAWQGDDNAARRLEWRRAADNGWGRRALLPRFHLITPVVPISLLRDLVAAGVDAVQIRDKRADDRTLLEFAMAAVDALRPLGAAVIVNDRLDIALVSGADGVHLGGEDLPVTSARTLAPELIVGATCRSRGEAVAARNAGASYAGVGPVFRSVTKPDLPEPLGVAAFAEITDVLPCIAIGGVRAADVPSLLGAGAQGVAVVAAVAHAPDPPTAAREFAAALRTA